MACGEDWAECCDQVVFYFGDKWRQSARHSGGSVVRHGAHASRPYIAFSGGVADLAVNHIKRWLAFSAFRTGSVSELS